MTKKRGIIAFAVIAVVVAAAGTVLAVQSHNEKERKEAAAEVARKKAAERRAEKERKDAERAAQLEACHKALDPLQRAAGDLRSAVSVGLVYDEHHDAVLKIARRYGRSDFESLTPGCLTYVGVPLEKALNYYRKADNYWNDSIVDMSEVSESKLQSYWLKAEVWLSTAADNWKKVEQKPMGVE